MSLQENCRMVKNYRHLTVWALASVMSQRIDSLNNKTFLGERTILQTSWTPSHSSLHKCMPLQCLKTKRLFAFAIKYS